MKVLSLICLILISFSVQSELSQSARDFLTGLVGSIEGNDFHLNDQCFGTDFDADVLRIVDAVQQENVMLLGAVGLKMASQINENCPTSNLTKYATDFVALVNSGKAPETLLPKAQEILRILKETINAPLTALTTGQTVGRVLKVILYNAQQNLNFLAVEDFDLTLSEFNVAEFVNGFFEGVSSVPFAQNKCVVDIQNYRTQINSVFENLVNAIRTRSNLVEAVVGLYQLANELQSLNSNCHFTQLSLELANIGSTTGIAKIGFRIATHLTKVVSDIRSVNSNIKSAQFRQAGVALGDLFQIVLKYSTI